MKKIIFLSLASIYALATELDFDNMEISAQISSEEDKVFTQAGAVSSRGGLNESTQSIDSIIRSIPGAYTQIDQAQGGVSVNIRGMSGFGRVNTMVDGVTQTFFSSATDNAFHGDIGTSTFTTSVDPNFLVNVDLTRGSFNGSNGTNSLMGSANFRTIGIDDIINQDKNFGLLSKYSYGTNAVGPSFMMALAAKHKLKNDANLGILFAYSGQNISQNYKIGGGGVYRRSKTSI